MHLCFSTIGSYTAEYTIERVIAGLSALNSHCLSHYRASTSKDLEIGHGPSARRDMPSGGRERTKSGRGGLIEKGTHGARLSEKRLHCASNLSQMYLFWKCVSFSREAGD